MPAKVNLLDCAQEPSDEQLRALMAAVVVDAKARAARANEALFETLKRQVAEARAAHPVVSQRLAKLR